MESKIFLPVILGTAREGRLSETIAEYIVDVLKTRESLEVQLIDPKEYIHGRTIPPWEENEITKPWREIATRALAFIIVSPEYNHGYPGELKMLLDQALDEYKDKPVGLCGVSSGNWGGVRVVEQLTQVVRELGMIVLKSSLYFPQVKELVKKSQEELDGMYKERLLKMADTLEEYLKR